RRLAELRCRIVADDREVILSVVMNGECPVADENWQNERNRVRDGQNHKRVIAALEHREFTDALPKNRSRFPRRQRRRHSAGPDRFVNGRQEFFFFHLKRIRGSTITYTMSERMFPTRSS